jgi:hypothetical protein
MNRIAFNGSSYLVINSAGDVIETCHNMATARHYARKMTPAMQTFSEHCKRVSASEQAKVQSVINSYGFHNIG